jgi:hypothetical protein
MEALGPGAVGGSPHCSGLVTIAIELALSPMARILGKTVPARLS